MATKQISTLGVAKDHENGLLVNNPAAVFGDAAQTLIDAEFTLEDGRVFAGSFMAVEYAKPFANRSDDRQLDGKMTLLRVYNGNLYRDYARRRVVHMSVDGGAVPSEMSGIGFSSEENYLIFLDDGMRRRTRVAPMKVASVKIIIKD